jgi:hypothetical protein
MSCQNCKDKFELYIDNELGNREKAEFESHLLKCPDCAKELAVLKSIDSVGKMEIFSAPEPAYWKQLNQNIMQQISGHKEKVSWFAVRLEQLTEILLPKRISYRLVGLAATAVIVFFIVHISVIRHGKFELPTHISSEDAIEISKPQNATATVKEDVGLVKEIPERKNLLKITESNQDKGTGLSKAPEKESEFQIPEAARRDENKILSRATQFMQVTTAEDLAVQKPTAPASAQAVQAEQRERADEFKMNKTTIQSNKLKETQFSVTRVSQRSSSAEHDSSLIQYQKICQYVQLVPDLNEKIGTWKKFLRTNPGEEAVKKVKNELAMLYYQLVEENPTQENIYQALTFYSENAQLLFSTSDSVKYQQQFERLQELFKKIEKKE